MTDKSRNSPKSGADDNPGWSTTAIAGAAIGSAALAAALLYVTRRRDAGRVAATPVYPDTAPETD